MVKKDPNAPIRKTTKKSSNNPYMEFECNDVIKMQNTKLAHSLVSMQKEYADVGKLDKECLVETSSVREKDNKTCVIFKLSGTGDAPDVLKNLHDLLDGGKLRYFDLSVMNAIYTIWTKRENYTSESCLMSYHDIARVMAGDSRHTLRISQETINNITESIDKMACLMVQLDLRAEIPRVKAALLNYNLRGTKMKETALLVSQTENTAANGKTVSAVELLRCPILFRYAEAIKQVIQVPSEALALTDDAGRKIYLTSKTVAFRDYLLRYITTLQSGSMYNRKISMKTIIEASGYEYDSIKRMAKKRDVEMIEKILKHLKKIGYLDNYKIDDEMVYFQI